MLNNILAIDPSGMLIIRDYSVNVKRMMELITQIDVVTPLEYESEVIPIKYAKASDISSALGALGGTTAATVGSTKAGGGARPAGRLHARRRGHAARSAGAGDPRPALPASAVQRRVPPAIRALPPSMTGLNRSA